MSMVYCVNCQEEKEYHIDPRIEVFKVRGEKINVESQVAICNTCGEEIFVNELDDANLARAYDAYREMHGMLSPSEIRQIRIGYGLSQGEFAQLLGWGRATINRYENNSIQSTGHDQTLKLIRNAGTALHFLEEARERLPESLMRKLEHHLQGLHDAEECHSIGACVSALLDSGKPSMENGFRRFDLSAVHQLSTFLAGNVKHFFKSKATKLLWYADFLAYKTLSQSITGCEYVAATYGPVPQRFSLLFDEMVESGVLRIEEVEFVARDGESFTKDLYLPGKNAPECQLGELELKCVQAVANEFRDLSSNSTIARAHKEEAYSAIFEQDQPWKTIPYQLAQTLSMEAIRG